MRIWNTEFKRGLKDGIPIGAGYFAVSIAFGILAVELGCTIVQAFSVSFTNLTSAGQFAGIVIITGTGSIFEMILTQLIINSRYMLMGISLSQKLDYRFAGKWRWILAFGITDEIFAVANKQNVPITKFYYGGLMVLPIIGWSSGTVVGAVLGNVLPDIVTAALGTALYAMFMALIVPDSKIHKNVLVAVLISISISVCYYYIPVLNGMSKGFVYIICCVVASAIAALLFPVDRDGTRIFEEDYDDDDI